MVTNLTIDVDLLRRETGATLMKQFTATDTEAEILNFVPGEVAVVVTAEDVADPAEFYQQVRRELNTILQEVLKSPEQPRRRKLSPLERDLQPDLLRQLASRERELLQPLRRPGAASRSSKQPALLPYLRLARKERGPTSWHLYFQIGRQRADLQGEYGQQRELVRQLVLLANRRLAGSPLGQTQSTLKSASPNWLTAAMPFSCGSPAGLPRAARPDKRLEFRFENDVEAKLTCAAPGKVVVAVLDTCPEQRAVEQAAKTYGAVNDLLVSVSKKIPMNQPPLLPNGALNHLVGCMPRLQWNMQAGDAHDHPEHFKMVDHGLFSAGIVFDIAGDCVERVCLIRVLNEYGMGDVLAISQVLMQLPEQLAGSGETRLVVNLSLGADVPIPARLLERWLPETARDARLLSSRLPEICHLLDSLHANLSDVTGWLAERGVLVVAAAGNDALRNDVTRSEPPPPRFPARYEDVLGVAAMRRDLVSAANFSNRGDVMLEADSGHIATFGGNVDAAASETEAARTSATDFVLGIVSSPLVGGEKNSTGWAKWSGTSFSTPIISAVAARLWACNPSWTPRQVMQQLHQLARHPGAGVDPDAPLEVPVLRVKQE